MANQKSKKYVKMNRRIANAMPVANMLTHGLALNHCLACNGLHFCISFTSPTANFVLHDLSGCTVLLARPPDNRLPVPVSGSPRRQGAGHERLALLPAFQHLDADFMVVQFHESFRRVCLPEFPFKNFRVSLTNPESHERADVTEHCLPDLRLQLVSVLVREREAEAVLSRFRKDRDE